MWATIKLKTKIAKRHWITCHCNQCVKKKWSRYQKKTDKRIKQVFISILAVLIAVDSVHNWYVEKWDGWTFINETNAEASASQPITPSTPVGETGTVTANQVSVMADTTQGEASPVSPQVEVVKRVAEKEGVDWKILWALFMKETRGDCQREGDHQFVKTSIGCYQINKHFHPEVTWKQATDLEWSSHWTAKRLKAKAEKFGWDNAVMMHNGSPSNPAVQAYLADVKKIIETL